MTVCWSRSPCYGHAPHHLVPALLNALHPCPPQRNLGDEVFYRLIEPFCSGVYAGDPSKLSMKAAFGRIHSLEAEGGSLVGGAIKLIQDRKKNPPPPRDPRLPPKPKGQTVGSFW